MKQKKITIPGKVTKDGKLSIYMGELNEFMKNNAGRNIIAEFTVLEPSDSSSLRGYYFKYVVPQFQKGMCENGYRWSEEETEAYMRSICPITMGEVVDIETGEYRKDSVKVTDLSNSEFVEYIEFLKQFAAEEFSIYIEEPNRFVR